MDVLVHHIYEYKKGLRNLVLHTMCSAMREKAEAKLGHQGICYCIVDINDKKFNIFFGAKECVDVIMQFGMKPLNAFTPEEDFILGTMLGYDSLKQCQRYIRLIRK